MQQFQSLKRLLIFYSLTLSIMLVLYYVMLFLILKDNTQQHSQMIFKTLQHNLAEAHDHTNSHIENILQRPLFQDISYQLILMMPSGQTYVYQHTRPDEPPFTTVSFPNIKPRHPNSTGAYKLTDRNLMGTLTLANKQRLYIVLRHQPIDINIISYIYWLPIMIALILFITALLYTLKRRSNWEQLLAYTEDVLNTAKDAYTPPPFKENESTLEFLRLGHVLGRIRYQLYGQYRRIHVLNHRLERLVTQAPLPMLMIMRQGQISFSNQRFDQVFSTSFQKNTTYTLNDFVTGSDKVTQQYLQKLTSQRVTRTILVYGLVDNQAYQLHISPWFGDHGQTHGFTVMFTNVNELLSKTLDLQQQNQQLNQQVTQLTALKSTLGHELRTPLNAIIGTLDLIEPNTLTNRQRDLLATLIQSSHSMLAMLNEMLDAAKSEAGKMEVVLEPTDIFKLSQQLSDLMVGSAHRNDLELLYFFMPNCPRYIDTDGKHLRQILLNLLDNAIKFTRSGYVALVVDCVSDKEIARIIQRGLVKMTTQDNHHASTMSAGINTTTTIPLTLSTSYHRLQHAINTEQPWLHFSIQDTGIGIGSQEQQKIFSYFTQANEQISSQFGGTGLGLAISSSFAQLLGGFIQLTSEKGVGSTFHLYLPAHKPTYKPVYQCHSSLNQIHLVAIVNQTVSATHLQRLCQYLNIRASIYSEFDKAVMEQLTLTLESQTQNDAVLLLDYEYYLKDINRVKAIIKNDNTILEKGLKIDDNIITDLHHFINSTPLPKLLLSMKPERSIPSSLLDSFDGFLSKPLDIARLLSELIRLTLPQNHVLSVSETVQQDPNSDNMTLQTDAIASLSLTSNRDNYQNKAPDLEDKENLTEPPLILVVEDNLTNQKITCKLLSKLGYRSEVAVDGQQALDKLAVEAQDFALILMDCRMPVMDGWQATTIIRQQGNSIPIIALTANNSEEDCLACFNAGMDEFLTKPINKDQLYTVLQRFITS